ncbi:SO2930 family diheme c-type cytochrome [Nitratireductor alexandrii]|uniref:SO2930 family diheme c-type cytochrome n=1 Tax=Nitratireductor alexandrii TaxID=2448161 RepID=UPI000FD6C4CD|nr:SO2930 family diheme c-type cytochrome [Nitratireductor alexandrii]
MLAAALAGPAAAVDDVALAAKRPPKLLSQTGLFADPATQKPAAGVIPFAITTPLFSDYALKTRFVYIPEGKAARYHDTEAFAFPVGSVLVKSFAFPADMRRPDEAVRLIETRLLIRRDDGWQAWAYLWNDEQTDATLNIAGAKVEIALAGIGETPDKPLRFAYSVPNKNQCKACHALGGTIAPIGPKARNLNDIFSYAEGPRNQLAHWSDKGILAGAPHPSAAPAVPDWRDQSAPLETRARAWLDVNCAHCHRRQGPASNSGLFLTYGETDPVALGIGKRPVAAGRGSGGRDFDISPGDPDGSILIYRVESTEPGIMMPELGRSRYDHAAVELLRDWIANLR